MRNRNFRRKMLAFVLCFVMCLSVFPAVRGIPASFFEIYTDWHFDLSNEPDRPMTQEEFIALTTAYSYWSVGATGQAPVDSQGNRPSAWAEPYIKEACNKGVIDPARLDYDAVATLAFATKFIVNSKGLYDIDAINLYEFTGTEGLSAEDKLCLSTAVDYGILPYTPKMDMSVTLPRKDLENKYLIPAGRLSPVKSAEAKSLNYAYSMAFIEDCYFYEENWLELREVLDRNMGNFNLISWDCIYLNDYKVEQKLTEDPAYDAKYVADCIAGKNEELQHAMLEDCRANGITILGGVVTWYDPSIMEMLRKDPSAIDQTVKELMEVVQRHDLDGLNMDVELSGNTHRETYSTLLRKLSVELKKQGKMLMVTAGGYMRKNNEVATIYDYEVLAEVADLVTLVTYDMHSTRLYNRGGEEGFMSNRTYTERCIRYAAMEIGAEKLLLGMASYGVHYNLTDHSAENILYADILALQEKYGATAEVVDPVADDYCFTYTDGGKEYAVYYESKEGINRRLSNVTHYGMAGTAFFYLQSENKDFFRSAGKKQTDLPFRDLEIGSWYTQGVEFAYERALFNGVSDNSFAPDASMTRAMLVTVLWRYAGKPVEGKNEFTDVPNKSWYTEAVAWAAHNGIVNGVGNNRFDPDGEITREQMAAILYRYAGMIGIDTSAQAEPGDFPDGGSVSGYAKKALRWAVAEGLIGGTKEGGITYLRPQGNATRAQVATILMRFVNNLAEK